MIIIKLKVNKSAINACGYAEQNTIRNGWFGFFL